MKRLFVCLLALALLFAAAAAEGIPDGLELQLDGMYLAEEWNGLSSDTHAWLVVQATLTNWRPETVRLADVLGAELVYLDKYAFEAERAFSADEVEPLVTLEGALVFRIPCLVAQAVPADTELTVTLEGRALPQEIALRPYSRPASDAHEGRGFASPEEAVLAYIEAMRQNDFAGMLSTFAIETFVDNSDAEATLTRLMAFSYASMGSMPVSNDYIRQILCAQRYGNLAGNLYLQYLVYTMGWDGEMIRLSSEDEIEAFLEAAANADFADRLRAAEFVEFLDPGQLSEVYFTENNQRNIARQAQGYGCDELRDMPALLRIGEERYLLCIQCARYGDTWYNLNLSGNIGNLLGISAYHGGLISIDALDDMQ